MSQKYEFLNKLPGAQENLELMQADLNDAASFVPCFTGVEYVMHIASPYVISVADPQKDLVDPAVNGTKAILELCKNTPSVKRLVMTSSIASVSDCFDSNKIYNENDWNEQSSLTRNPYYYSKTLAEKEAVNFMQTQINCHFDIIRILPFLTMGPSLNGSLNESHGVILAFLTGRLPGITDLSHGISDVRDIATAHIIAMEKQEAEGRYHILEIKKYV